MSDQSVSHLPARTGWLWLKEGWSLLRRQPGALTTVLFTNMIAFLFVTAIPYIGGPLAVLMIPSFAMSIMQTCAMVEQGRPMTLTVLGTGFRKPVMGPLFRLGAVYLLAGIILAALTFLTMDEQAIADLQRLLQDPANANVDATLGPRLLLLSVAEIVVTVLLAFAAPLVTWQRMGVGKAIFYSFFAAVRAVRVFLVLVLAWLAIMFVASSLLSLALTPFGAVVRMVVSMWLSVVFMLLLQCAIYAGYRQIFGAPKLD